VANTVDFVPYGDVGFVDGLDGSMLIQPCGFAPRFPFAVEDRHRFVELLTVKDRVGFWEM